MFRTVLSVILLAAAFVPAARSQVPQAAPFDVLIVNARMLDGSGNPWVRADIGIRGDRIVAMGRLGGSPAAQVIDAADRIVAPGFIDVHSHALEGLTRPELRDARPLIAQGITLVVGNPDGGGATDLARQAEALAADGGVGVNVALMIGHGSVRSAFVKPAQRAPTAEELEQMKAMVRQAMSDGAFGLSSGLFYTPGRFAKTEEVIALAREAGGVYTSHIRDEGNYDVGVIASVDEVIRVAEEAKVRGVVSHMKALGPDSWGQSKVMVEHIEAARSRGVEVFADQYPYEASSTSLGAAVMPGEGSAGVKEAMSGEVSRQQFLAIVKENVRRRGGPASIVMASGRGATGLAGRSLEAIAKERGVPAEQAAVDIVLAGGASIVSFNMSEGDIETIMRQTWTMGSSDGGLSTPGAGQPHPRNNGAFARRLARYVRERKTVSLEHAVRTMTSLPARVFGFTDRGELRTGAFADVVIFDPARVQEKATYTEPHHLAEGIDVVIVNGVVTKKDATFTGAKAGRVLKKGV